MSIDPWLEGAAAASHPCPLVCGWNVPPQIVEWPKLKRSAPPVASKEPEATVFAGPGSPIVPAPGKLTVSEPIVPYTPATVPLASRLLLPPTQVHSLVEGLNSHRSFRFPSVPAASKPAPPKSQRFPFASVQPSAPERPPGVFVAVGVPRWPNTPGWPPLKVAIVLLPETQVHSSVEGSNSQRSLREPRVSNRSSPASSEKPEVPHPYLSN